MKVPFPETRFVPLVGPHGELEMEKEVISDAATEAGDRREKKRTSERIGKEERRREEGEIGIVCLLVVW